LIKPLITIYITNHNYGRFISKSINSVLNQSFKKYELIIIDDGSTDNSIDIINKYCKKNKDIIFIKQNKRGLVASNNIAINLAKGRYIVRLDADDWLKSDALKEMFKAIEINNKIAMVFPDYYEVDIYGRIISRFVRHNFKKVNLKDQPAHGACSLIRLSILKKIGGYDEKFMCQDGYYIWMKLLKYDVKNINKPLFYYRKHGSNLTSNISFINKTKTKILDYINRKSKKKAIAILAFRGSQINRYSFMMKKLNGKELIRYSIDSCLKCKKISKIVVSTNDEKALRTLKKKYLFSKRILFHKREQKLSLFNTPIIDTLKNCMNFLRKKNIKFDYVYSVNTSYPFISENDFNNSFNILDFFKLDRVIGVLKEKNNFYFHNGKTLKKINDDTTLRLEKNEIYAEPGSISIFDKKNMFKKKIKTGHIILEKLSCFQIEDEDDFLMAKIFKKIKN
jgi:glycosyltransferase involved in cell wall biosynthesis|tara:strand:+ start:10511 stop:11863 length:1353 start_codon:yes stop_codon:yes gene_type:complete